MIKSNKRNRVVVTSALILTLAGIALAAAGPAAPAQPAEDPLKLIPADSLFCVRINNLNGALGQLDLFLTGLSPMGVSMPVKGMLGQILGSPEPVGVNMAGSFAIFGPLPDGNDTNAFHVGILVPVTDYQKFISGNPNIKPANAQGVSKITAQQDQTAALVVQVGGYALAGLGVSDPTLVALKKTMTAATTGVGANLDAAELKKAQSAPVWAYLNVPVVAKKYGPMLKNAMQSVKGIAGAAQGPNAPGAQTQAMAIDMYGSVLDSLMNQARFATLTLEPNATVVRAAVTVAALPNTQMADVLKGSSPQLDTKMLGYTREGAAMNFALSLDPAKWEKINTLFLDAMTKSMAQSLSAEDIAQIKKLTADSTGALGGTIVGSLMADPNKKPPFNLRYVATLKDPAKFNQVLDEAVKMINGGALGKLYQGLGLKMTADLKRKTASYKGVDIDTMRVSLAMTDANAPESKALAAMYGNGVNIQFAATNGLLVYAFGDPNTIIRATIDQIKAGGPTGLPSETRTALQLIPDADKASCFATLNLLRMMQMGTAIVPLPTPLPPTTVPTQSDVAVDGTCGDGRLTLEMAVPKQHVTEIMQTIMQLQQQMTQPVPPMQPVPTQPQPQPPASSRRGGARSSTL